MVLGTYKADVVSVSANAIVVQLNGSGFAPTSPLLDIGQQQNVCDLIIDAWGY